MIQTKLNTWSILNLTESEIVAYDFNFKFYKYIRSASFDARIQYVLLWRNETEKKFQCDAKPSVLNY